MTRPETWGEWTDALAQPSPVPFGTRIELILMPDDPYPIESGTRGTVIAPSNGAQMHVRWDNGRTLMLIPGWDQYRVVDDLSNELLTRGGAT